MAKSNASGLLTSLDSLFTTQEQRDAAKRAMVLDLPLDQIGDFPNHPFKVRQDEAMMEMMESVQLHGVLVPGLVRQLADGSYQMVSGHRRKLASKLASRLAGLDTLPCIVRDLTDDEAIIVMVDSNLQREKVLPSEKAFAYKMKLEAMRRQGKRTDLTLSPLETKLRTSELIAQGTGDSRAQVDRYIRLTYLLPEILAMVDDSKIAFRPAVELSYLAEKEQRILYDAMGHADCTPSLAQAIKMKSFSREGKLSETVIRSIMAEEKPNQKEQFRIPKERISKYFKPGTPARLIALHDLECPWRPSDLQQRLGRIVRQGNQNPEVEIFRYVTEGTFDAYLYQLVESKQRFIAQIMTSKLPARAAEDVDETALSYAEIKALATGNPQIIEKCNLDMEVSKLNMLRASHLSQRYALEELVLRKYPAEIKELNERIAGYEQDSARLAEHPKPVEGIAPMVLNGVIYTERENAGKAIIHACTHMNGAETIPVGSYRGFDMTLNYDSKTNEFHMTLKGSLSHTAVLGADAGGNVTRIDNVLEKIDERLESARSQLAHTSEQLENARTEMVAPFPKEAELAEKTRRLNELNVMLNLNEPDRVVMSEEPDEGGKPHPRTADRER